MRVELGDTSSLFHREDGQECFLRNFDSTDLLHALLSFLLLLEKLSLTGDISTVALGQNVFPHGADRFTRDDLTPYGGLDGHFKHLARDQLPQLRAHLPPPLIRLRAVNDRRQRIDGLIIQEYIELHEIGLAILEEIVVERCIATGDRLQLVIEIENNL